MSATASEMQGGWPGMKGGVMDALLSAGEQSGVDISVHYTKLPPLWQLG